MRFHFISFFLFFFLIAINVSATGFGVNPAYLDFNIHSSEDLKQEMYVINNDYQKYYFSLYSDSSTINANPSEFALEAGQSKRVLVELDPAMFKGDFNSTLFIVSGGAEESNIRTGIKMPIFVEIFNRGILKEAAEAAEELTVEKHEEGKEKVQQPTPTVAFFSLAANPTASGIIIAAFILIIAIYLIKRRDSNKQRNRQ